ncbi:MAG: hypothetical protein DHS20C15_11680 [Planctomycetota bacterium]|nr:MAG: hypothetical protein DHS20C15_11680 [Planctomycetota bacterium]
MILAGVLIYQNRGALLDVLGVDASPPTPGASAQNDARDTAAERDAARNEDGSASAAASISGDAQLTGDASLSQGDALTGDAPTHDPTRAGAGAGAGAAPATAPAADPAAHPATHADETAGASQGRSSSVAPESDRAHSSADTNPNAGAPPPTPGGEALPLLDSLLGANALNAAEALHSANRLDEVFTAIDALALAELAPQALRTWQAEQDPLHTARVELLLDLAALAADDADDALTRDLPLLAALRVEEARALFDTAARLTADPAVPPQLADLLVRTNALHAQLFNDLEGTRQLSARGASLPPDARRGSASTERRWNSADLKRTESGEAATQQRGRLSLTSRLDSADAEHLLDACEAALDAVEDRWSGTGRDALELVLHNTLASFEQAREESDAAIPNDARAFLLPDTARIVALDPRFHGEPFARLPGLLAREIARWTLRRAHAEGGALPTWLEEGWARAYEGWALSGDAETWRAHAPLHLTERLLLDLNASGPGRADLDSLLELRPASEEAGAAAYGFVRHLERAKNAEGEWLFADELALLASSRREGLELEARAELRLRFTLSDAQQAAGITTQLRLQLHWWDAEKRALELDLAEGAAAAALWQPIDAHLARREVDAASAELRRISTRRPLDPELRRRRLRLSERLAERDARLLEALLLARCAGQDDAAREEAWSSARRVNRALAESLQAQLEASHEAARALVERHLIAGRSEGARLLLDLLQAAMPSDPAWRALQTGLTSGASTGGPLELAVHPLMHASGRGVTSEDELWDRRAKQLGVRAADRSEPSDLSALWELRSPFSLRATVALERPVPLLASDEHRRLGLSFGARHALDPGSWAVLFGAGGQVEVGVRGSHEWPTHGLGKAPRERFALELHVDRAGFSVTTDDRAYPWQAAGTRTLDGGLGVLARQINATLTDLRVDLRPRFDPRGHWALVGGP